MPKFCVMNISGFINRDVHPQNFHLSISIVKKHTFYCVSNKLLYFFKPEYLGRIFIPKTRCAHATKTLYLASSIQKAEAYFSQRNTHIINSYQHEEV